MPHTPTSEDFVLDNNQTNIILGLSGRTVQKSLVDWVEGESIPDGQIAMTKRRGPKGHVMNFIAQSSVLAYLRLYGQSVNISRARGVIQDPTIIEKLESHNRTVQPSDDSSEAPRDRSERVREGRGDGVIEQMEIRIAEKDERIADLQRRLDEKDGKYEQTLIAKMGAERALSNVQAKVQAVDPEIVFLPIREGDAIVDVQVTRTESKRTHWWSFLFREI